MLHTLILVLIAVESGGNSGAVGDNGRAIGVLQIHRVVVEDVNRVYKMAYTHQEMADPRKAKHVAELYLRYWGGQYAKQVGRPASLEVLARIWNGGPDGWKKKSTMGYWKKVRQQLK